MASSPQQQSTPIEQAFVADRAMFWNRFTGFAKWSTIGIVGLLAVIYVWFG